MIKIHTFIFGVLLFSLNYENNLKDVCLIAIYYGPTCLFKQLRKTTTLQRQQQKTRLECFILKIPLETCLYLNSFGHAYFIFENQKQTREKKIIFFLSTCLLIALFCLHNDDDNGTSASLITEKEITTTNNCIGYPNIIAAKECRVCTDYIKI